MANIQSNVNQLISMFSRLSFGREVTEGQRKIAKGQEQSAEAVNKGLTKFGERQEENETVISELIRKTKEPSPEEVLKRNEAAWFEEEAKKSEALYEQGKRDNFFRELKKTRGWPEPAKHPKGIDFYADEETGRFVTIGAAAERLNTVETGKEFRNLIFNKPQKIGTDIETVKPQKIGGNK